jgi:hypothetical protein|tara:strand:+ start:5292 stop:5675 length:384 start_codon:yes stop_codon:yes gene_type:complete
MARQVIGIGTTANDGTGDSLRASADKTNDNFSEVYTLLGDGTTLPSAIVTELSAGTNITLTATTGIVTITSGINTTNVKSDTIVVSGITTSSNGFVSSGSTGVQINLSGSTLTFNVPGVGSTSLTLF